MKTAIEKLNSSTAISTIASGMFGNRIMFAPPDEGGDGGDDQEGAERSQSEGEQGGEGDDQNTDDGKKSALDGKGLFKKKEAETNDDDRGEREGNQDGDRPDNVAEKFWDADKKEVKVDDMAKAYKDLESAYGKLKRDKGIEPIPEKPEDYFTEKLDFEDGDLKNLDVPEVDDPLLKDWAEACHELEISPDKAKALAKEMFKRIDNKAPERIDRETELKALGKNGQNVIDGVFTWLEGMERSGDISERDIEIAGNLSATADGIKFLNKMRSMTGQEPLPTVSSAGKSMSAQDWHTQYQAAIGKNDYGEQERLDTLANVLWPDGIPKSNVPDANHVVKGAR